MPRLNINFCDVSAQACLYSLGEVVLFFVSVLLLLLKPVDVALPWQIQAFYRDFTLCLIRKYSQPLG